MAVPKIEYPDGVNPATHWPDGTPKRGRGGADLAVWRGDKQLVDSRFGARTIGDLALVEPGCSVWSEKRTRVEEPLGGVVIEIIDVRDEDTGFPVRSFRTINPYEPLGVAIRVLSEAEISRDGMEAPESSRIAKQIRRLAEAVAKGKGPLVQRDRDYVAYMHRLMGVV